MIKSKTKYSISEEKIIRIFENANIHEITKIIPLGGGEFNSVFEIHTAAEKGYALKIAPPRDSRVLSYENKMMESEVFWYKQISENTDISVPHIYYHDFSCALIDACYFIMELMEGKPLWAFNFSRQEYETIQKEKINMLTKIHRIHNHQFGYLQTGLYPTWYEAVCSMIQDLITDCEKLGKETADGKMLLQCVKRHEEILKKIPGSMVNFDLWDSNIIYHNGSISWIDPERSFWGDPVADFIPLGKGHLVPLSHKQEEIEIYNRTAESSIFYNEEVEIRYQVAVGLLALMEEVEKYIRYDPEDENYIRNSNDARIMYDMVFSILNR